MDTCLGSVSLILSRLGLNLQDLQAWSKRFASVMGWDYRWLSGWVSKVNCWLLFIGYCLYQDNKKEWILQFNNFTTGVWSFKYFSQSGKNLSVYQASSFTLLGPMFMLLGLGLDNIFTVKCWPSCLIIAQYYSLLLGNYITMQIRQAAGRPAYGGAMAWHLLTFHTDCWAGAWVSSVPANTVYASL